MFESFEDFKNYSFIIVVLFSIITIAISGLFFGVTYFILDSTQTAFQSTNCVIENNTLVDSCQELFELGLYPFLALKDVLIWLSFFFIFALAIGLLVLGYQSGRSPVLMGFSVVIVIVMTYISIHISNIYRTLLDNEVFRSMMVDFTVYNKIMLNFPLFVFIITLMAALLSVVNFQRTKVNNPASPVDLDY